MDDRVRERGRGQTILVCKGYEIGHGLPPLSPGKRVRREMRVQKKKIKPGSLNQTGDCRQKEKTAPFAEKGILKGDGNYWVGAVASLGSHWWPGHHHLHNGTSGRNRESSEGAWANLAGDASSGF